MLSSFWANFRIVFFSYKMVHYQFVSRYHGFIATPKLQKASVASSSPSAIDFIEANPLPLLFELIVQSPLQKLATNFQLPLKNQLKIFNFPLHLGQRGLKLWYLLGVPIENNSYIIPYSLKFLRPFNFRAPSLREY